MKSLAKIRIAQFQVASIIGIYPHERTQAQALVFDVELIVDIKNAAKSDKIADTINYEYLMNDLKDFVTQKKYFLIEALAESLIDHLMQKYQPKGLRICIGKPNALADAKCVSIIVERGKI